MKNIEVGSVGTKRLVVLAQLSTLAALAMGLQFLFNTTGGTLFLFASVAPVLVMVSIVIVLAVLTRISVLALARPQYTSAPARMPRLFALNPAHQLRR